METLAVDPELQRRRDKVAMFIKTAIRPVEQLLEEQSATQTDPGDQAQTPDFEMREYQLDAWAAIWEARYRGESSALITLATGLGKTSVGVFDVIKFRQEFIAEHGREPKVLFACHQNELRKQAASRFKHFIPDMSQGDYGDGDKELSADITFGTLQSLTNDLEDIDPSTFDYIIYDEAHHAQAESFKKVVEYFKPSFQLALTATPDREDGLDIRELFGQEKYAKGLAEALAEGWLADIDYHIVFDEVVKAAMESDFEPQTLQELHGMFAVTPRNQIIAKNVGDKMHEMGLDEAKAVVFCSSIEHAEEMAKLLNGQAYHSDLKDKDRVLKDFRTGQSKIICTVDMFNEGVDIPDANLLVFLRSTSSKTIFEQQLGRGLRKTKGKTVVSVLDFVANIERIQFIKELSDKIATRTYQGDIGERGNSLDAVAGSSATNGIGTNLRVHSSGHSNFIFDRLAVSVLDKYNSVQSNYATEGEMSVLAFSKSVGISNKTISKLMAEHGILTVTRKFGTKPGQALNVEAQERLLALPELKLSRKQEGEMSIEAFALSVGSTQATISKLIKKYDVETVRRRLENGVPGFVLMPEAQLFLKDVRELVEDAAADDMLLSQFAASIGKTSETISQIIKQNELPVIMRRFGGTARKALDVETQKQLMTLVGEGAERANEHDMSVGGFAKSVGSTHATISKLIVAHEIETTTRRFGAFEGDALSPDAQAKLRALPELSMVTLQNNEVGIQDFANTVGLGAETIRTIIKANKLPTVRRKFSGGKPGQALTPEVQVELRQIIAERPEQAKEGEISVNAFAQSTGISRTKVKALIAQHGVQTNPRFFGKRPGQALSPEAQTQLREVLDQAKNIS